MLIERVNFSKRVKLHESLGQVQSAVLEKFTTAYYTKLHIKSCYYFLIVYMKEHHEGQRQTKCLERARAICNLRSCYNFAFVLHENALVFSQAGARNFFMYIINRENSHVCDIFIVKKKK